MQSKQNIPLEKVAGYEFLDKPQPECNLKSYNEEYFSSLNSMKQDSFPIEDKIKLAFGAQVSHESSVTSITGQVLHSYEELIKSNIELFKQIYSLRQEIKLMSSEIEKIDKEIIHFYKPQIEKFRKMTQNFLVEQKTEDFRLYKEIKILESEKIDLQEKIFNENQRLIKLESIMGKKNNAFTDQFNKSLKSGNKLFNGEYK